jgi:phosphatidylglycerol:prolipoprotein diacylglycerol transferase
MRPILFHLPNGLPVYAYGTMLGLSFAVGWYLTLGLGVREGLRRGLLARCFLVTAATAVLGAKLLFLATNPERVHSLADVLTRSGFVAYGGFLGGFAGAAAFCARFRLPFLLWADAAVPSLATGLTLTRVGCFLAGCDFGTPSTGALAVRFPLGSPAFSAQRAAGLLPAEASTSLPVHPTQLYESACGVLLLAVVLGVRARPGRRPGEALAAFTAGYAALRFGLEFVRADEDRGSLGPFSTSQWIALATAVAALGLVRGLRGSAASAST